jgi:hypothetical protein
MRSVRRIGRLAVTTLLSVAATVAVSLPARSARADGTCVQVRNMLRRGLGQGDVVQLTGLSPADVQFCAQQRGGRIPIQPAGPPPLGAAGPAPLGAAGPAPHGAAGPAPRGAAGPAPLGAAGPPPLGATGPAPGGSAR